jgi:hypothetical protein
MTSTFFLLLTKYYSIEAASMMMCGVLLEKVADNEWKSIKNNY